MQIDRFDTVLESLPPWIQDIVVTQTEGLEEIRVVTGYPLTLNQAGMMRSFERRCSKEDCDYIRDKLGGFKSNWRAGIDRTLHRYSGIPNTHDALIGVVIRLARALEGIAEPLRKYLGNPGGLMLVGKPGTGKTSLLRDIIRLVADDICMGQLCVAVDTSNELGGDGDYPHPALGNALRVQVGEPSRQGERLKMAIANLTPKTLAIDEIGYHGNDVMQVATSARRGVNVISTLHGNTLSDAVFNQSFSALLGDINYQEARRKMPAVFKMALELVEKGRWLLYPNLDEAVDDILKGQTPKSIEIGAV